MSYSALKASLIDGAIREGVSGLVSEYRAYFRSVGGFEGSTQQVPVSLTKIQERVQSRMDGMTRYIKLGKITIPQLQSGLIAIGLRTKGDSVVFQVAVPAPRSAHAR